MIRLAEVTAEQRGDFLPLERTASAAYNDFVYRDAAQAEAVRGFLFDKGVAEFAPAYSRVLMDGEQVLGMIACLSAPALSKCRMRSAYALARSSFFEEDPALSDHMALAGQSLLRPEQSDFYLSRIAVASGAAGAGLGRTLLDFCLGEGVRAGSRRLVLEVASDNQTAIAFYKRNGFEHVGSGSAQDPRAGRHLSYLHMARPL